MRLITVIALLCLACAGSAGARTGADQQELAPTTASAVTHGEGISEDEAVLRALKQNPSLRAFRKQRNSQKDRL